MAQILGRIKIMHEQGAEIAYTTDLNVLRQLGLQPDQEFRELTVIKKGTVLTFSDGKKMEVTRMYTYFYETDQEINPDYGINLYGYGENHPFNFEITYYVKEVE